MYKYIFSLVFLWRICETVCVHLNMINFCFLFLAGNPDDKLRLFLIYYVCTPNVTDVSSELPSIIHLSSFLESSCLDQQISSLYSLKWSSTRSSSRRAAATWPHSTTSDAGSTSNIGYICFLWYSRQQNKSYMWSFVHFILSFEQDFQQSIPGAAAAIWRRWSRGSPVRLPST